MKKHRLSLKQALDRVNKEEFEISYRKIENTLSDISKLFNISVSMVKRLAEYWDISWSKEEISARKKYNSSKYDHQKSNLLRLETNLNRYGTYNPRTILHPDSYSYDKNKIDLQQNKYKETCKSKYGTPYYSQTDKFKNGMVNSFKKTMLLKYGVDHFMKVPELKNRIIQAGRGSYYYKDLYFKSSWELAFYIFHLDNGDNIIHSKFIKPFKYIYNSVEHSYFPDFILNGDYIEIKGWQFLDNNGNLINPYNHNLDGLSRAKQECMIANNVKLLTQDDIQYSIDYIIDQYGPDFLKNCKLK
jgi:hypothetical protein